MEARPLLDRMRARLTYANVVATLSLFLVVSGGVAWALATNSVKSRHIAPGQVKSGDLRVNAVTGAHVRDDSLASADVRPDGLNGADINESALGTVPTAGDADTVDGADASDLKARHAVVLGNGTLAEGSGQITVTKSPSFPGIYLVDFGTPIEGSVQATIGNATALDGGEIQANLCTGNNSTGANCADVDNDRSIALVYTFNSSGARTDQKFTITAFP